MNLRRILLTLATLLLLAVQAQAQVVVTDDVTSNTTWTSSNEYILNGLIFVDSLVTLTIEPGTVIKARQTVNITSGDGASALIVRRGGKLIADGTAAAPIIFTSELDDINNPNDLSAIDRGLWGGVILLGNATTNQPTTNNQIEGIPSTENALFGGTNDADNSGILRYISIRHGGFSISGVPGDEINGLTLGAIGYGTIIEHIEVFANFDDGYEWFGGTVDTKWLVAAFCADDAFDYDMGFRGRGQFWFTVQAPDEAGRGGEHDGGDDDETGFPYSIPVISNVTYIGSGIGATPGGDGNDRSHAIRDNAGGKYYNSIFTEYVAVGPNVEDLASGEDSRSRLENGDLLFSNNYWWDFGAGNTLSAIAPQPFVADHLAANGNTIANPGLRGIDRNPSNGLDPRPTFNSPVVGSGQPLADGWFVPVGYLGAFNPNEALWTDGWTALDALGHTGDLAGGTAGTVHVTADISSNTTWTANNVYDMDGLIFVDSLATLTIEPGTVIKARQTANITTGDGASALVIRRGGKIMASGTPVNPIIFTSELDDITNPSDLTAIDRGLWGGVIVLGNAVTNQPTTNNQIEGIPSTENALFGGNNDDDNSGVLRYISIRHGGFSISGVPGDEINGLTLGAVGRGTTVEYIEVFANFDDGYEWFGGTVNTKNIIAAFCADDAFDYDMGFRGKGQFWFSIQGPDEAGRGGEHDGGDDDETGTPYAIPVIANATYIGSGVGATPGGDGNDRSHVFRDNAGGKYYSSIFTDFVNEGPNVEDLTSGEDSRSRLENGDLLMSTNVWWNFGAGNTLAAIAPQTFVADHLAANNNSITDPGMTVSWNPDGTLDPRPTNNLGTPVIPADPFFEAVDYLGAFDPNDNIWTYGWTALEAYGHMHPTALGIEEEVVASTVPADFSLSQNYPNPFNPSTKIDFNLAKSGDVSITVYNIRGQKVATLVSGYRAAGQYSLTWNASQLPSGVYFYTLQAAGKAETRKMMLVK